MLPDIGDWLRASWSDYRRRWTALMAVLAAGSLATAAGVFLPLLPAGLATGFGVGSLWRVWGAASSSALLIGLWLSTWAQAAAVRAASADEGVADSLGCAWRQTYAFGWVLTLVLLAAGGGFVLLVVPGLCLSALLFFAPFYQLSGEGDGMAALELSFARVLPVLGPVSLRLALVWAVAAAPSWIPWIGWLVGPLWAPFGLVASARLAADLKALAPFPEKPRGLGAAVAALSAVLMLALGAGTWATARGARMLYASYMSGEFAFRAPDSETATALLAVLQGKGSDADLQRALSYALSLSPEKAP